jgi:16S rRNA processing protein RimM
VGSVLYPEGRDDALTVVWSAPAKPGLLLRFQERTDRSSVEDLRECYLEATPVTPLPPETWYWHQIEGLEARSSAGEILGRVSDVFRAGAGEVYVVTGGPRGEVLVPAVRGVVIELRPEAGYLVVDLAALALDELAPGVAAATAGGEWGGAEADVRADGSPGAALRRVAEPGA